MFTNNPTGKKPVYHHLKTESAEALWIADTIAEAVKEGRMYCDHAVLVRASSQTRALEEAFIRRRVPYKILNGAQFYSSEEIKTVLAYLRMIYSMNDLDFVWTIQHPRKGFGKKSIASLRQYAGEKKLTLFEALGMQIEQGMIRKSVMVEYYNGIRELHNTYQNYLSKDLVNAVLDLGYREELQNDVDQTKLDNIAEFITTVAALEEDNKEQIPLEDLLAHFALFSQQDDDVEKDLVKVMTIHTAKGLEFDTVFVNGMVEGQFPSKRLRNEDEIEEERRLFYVAVTRAMKRLYISSYESKGGTFFTQQSSFLNNIDVELLDCINNSKIGEKYTTPNSLPKTCFSVGDVVNHKLFGKGRIVNVDEKMQVYAIDFEHVNGIRRLQFRADLTLLSEGEK